jgi:hypothetical protein
MAVVYNYFEPIPIPDPENPKFESRICKTCQSPKELKREKVDILRRRRLGSVFFSDLGF